MIKPSDLKAGDKVIMPAFYDEGELLDPQARMEIIEVDDHGMATARVYELDRTEDDIDGLREFLIDDLTESLEEWS